MAWIQISITTSKAATEAAETCLFAHGAQTVTLSDAADQPILEPEPGQVPLWDNAVVTGLFPADTDTISTEASLKQCLQSDDVTIHHEILEDRNWTRAWMDNYHPMQFGSRLWVCPRHVDPPDSNAVNLRLDPGLAFGTGTHPTTSLCLRWLDANVSKQASMLDFGCGSGILAIAACLLGITHVDGVDIDEQALQATRDNALANNVQSQTEAYLPLEFTRKHATSLYDIVIANILSGPLAELAPQLAGHCKHGGDIVLSGILSEQAENIRHVYAEFFHMDAPVRDGDWVLLHGTRR